MSSDLVKLIELLLIVGLIAWFGIAQIRSVRKPPPGERKDAGDESGGNERKE